MIVFKRHLVTTFAALTMTGLAFAGSPKSEYVDSVGDAWQKAFKAGDLDGVMKLYADDAVGWFPEEAEHKGLAAIRASYKAFFDANVISHVELTNRHHLSDANHRTNWGNFTIIVKQKSDGKQIPMTGRYTDVQEKRNGQWVYIVDHASANPPEAPPAAPPPPPPPPPVK